LIYFDFDKAASLFSQSEGGLLKDWREEQKNKRDQRRGAKLDIKLASGELADATAEEEALIETRVLHHDLLSRVERRLFESQLAIDMNQALSDSELTHASIRTVLSGEPYVRVEGWALIHDYERIKRVASSMSGLEELQRASTRHALSQTGALQELEGQLRKLREAAERASSHKKKQGALAALGQIERAIEDQINEAVGERRIAEWIAPGISLFIDALMPGRMIVRVHPFESCPDFYVLANLKRQCFLDSDTDNIIFEYGARPNLKLTVLGLITSMPPEQGHQFSGFRQEQKDLRLANAAPDFEGGFQKMFESLEQLDVSTRFLRYPNVTVYPLAVYRPLGTESD